MIKDVNKIVLAYSGGLDTSVILKWLQQEYKCEVVTFTADLGQGEEIEPAREKAKSAGVKEIFIEDLREEFVRDFVFPMFRANTVYKNDGTSQPYDVTGNAQPAAAYYLGNQDLQTLSFSFTEVTGNLCSHIHKVT